MPAVCSICYHRVKHRYRLEEVGLYLSKIFTFKALFVVHCSSFFLLQEPDQEIKVCISSAMSCQENKTGPDRLMVISRIQDERQVKTEAVT